MEKLEKLGPKIRCFRESLLTIVTYLKPVIRGGKRILCLRIGTNWSESCAKPEGKCKVVYGVSKLCLHRSLKQGPER